MTEEGGESSETKTQLKKIEAEIAKHKRTVKIETDVVEAVTKKKTENEDEYVN